MQTVTILGLYELHVFITSLKTGLDLLLLDLQPPHIYQVASYPPHLAHLAHFSPSG